MTRVRDDVAALRRQLEAERLRLEDEIARFPMGNVEQIGHGNHMAEDASDAFEQAKSLALRRHMEGLLAEVQEALQRLDSGTYGLCLACGEVIDPARLEVLPYASLCLRCKALAEMR